MIEIGRAKTIKDKIKKVMETALLLIDENSGYKNWKKTIDKRIATYPFK